MTKISHRWHFLNRFVGPQHEHGAGDIFLFYSLVVFFVSPPRSLNVLFTSGLTALLPFSTSLFIIRIAVVGLFLERSTWLLSGM